jgi:hypothetical protein
VQALRDFFGTETIELRGDLQVQAGGVVIVSFEWVDRDNEIIFPKSPEGGRQLNLWQQTCFEAFIKTGASEYFEINLSTKGAWNVYRFDSYRSPQPPQEHPGAELLSCHLAPGNLEARLLIPGADLTKIQAGLTAVILLTSGPTYWSLKHAGPKPDFHLAENFTLERKTNV